MDDGALIDFFVSSGFGGRTQKPFVQIVIKAADYMVQMSPAEARDLRISDARYRRGWTLYARCL